jgi:hypothetical protein
MATTIAVMALMNLQNTANLKAELASVTCSRVTMEIAFRAFIFAVSFWQFQTATLFSNFC